LKNRDVMIGNIPNHVLMKILRLLRCNRLNLDKNISPFVDYVRVLPRAKYFYHTYTSSCIQKLRNNANRLVLFFPSRYDFEGAAETESEHHQKPKKYDREEF
jgi:hypothetical protein